MDPQTSSSSSLERMHGRAIKAAIASRESNENRPAGGREKKGAGCCHGWSIDDRLFTEKPRTEHEPEHRCERGIARRAATTLHPISPRASLSFRVSLPPPPRTSRQLKHPGDSRVPISLATTSHHLDRPVRLRAP